jgi:hypothetical protein
LVKGARKFLWPEHFWLEKTKEKRQETLMKTDTSIRVQIRKGAMLRQRSPRNAVSRTGLCLLAVVLLACVATPKANAQTNRYAEDAARLEAVAEWVSGAWSFFDGARTAVEFLTGFDGQTQLSLADIRETVISALKEVNAQELASDTTGLVDVFHEVEVQTRAVASDAMKAGRDMDSIMASSFATSFLATRLADLSTRGTILFNKLEPILRAPTTLDDRTRLENEVLAIAVMPAYTALVPLLVSTMKLIGEIEPSLKSAQNQLINEKLAAAQQTLFMAAGAYSLWVPSEKCGFEIIRNGWFFELKWTCRPSHFYAPVGKDVGFLHSRPFYAHYTFDRGTNPACHIYDLSRCYQFVSPDIPFYQYQTIPIVKLALDSLESIGDVACSMVSADDVLVWDPGVDTSSLIYNYGSHVSHANGWIMQVRQEPGASRCTTPQRAGVPALPQ